MRLRNNPEKSTSPRTMKKKIIPFVPIGMLRITCNQNTKTESTSATESVASVTNATANTISREIPAGIAPNTVMTEEYVKSVLKLIYLWGWPMVNVHNRVETAGHHHRFKI
jgi:hypothetical protein